MRSITKEYDLIDIAKKCRSCFAQRFYDFAHFLKKSKLLGMRLYPYLLHHCTPISYTTAPLSPTPLHPYLLHHCASISYTTAPL